MFHTLCLHFVGLVVSHLGIEDGTLVLIVPVPGHRIAFTLCQPDLEEVNHPTISLLPCLYQCHDSSQPCHILIGHAHNSYFLCTVSSISTADLSFTVDSITTDC